MKQMKIRIKNPEHSKKVQKALFELGYEWLNGKTFKRLEQPFLFTWSDGDITYSGSESHFENRKYPEYVLQNGTLVPVNQTIMKDDRFPFHLTQTQAQDIVIIACSSWREKLAKKWGKELLFNGHVRVSEGFYKQMREACTAEQHQLFDEIFGKDEPVRTLQEIVDEFEGRITLSTEGDDKPLVDGKRIIIYTPSANTQWFLEAVEYFQNLLQYLHKQPEIRKYNTFPTIENDRLTIVVTMEY